MAATVVPSGGDTVVDAITEKSSVNNGSEANGTTPGRPASVVSGASFKSAKSQTPVSAETNPSSAPLSHGPTKVPLTALSSKSKATGLVKKLTSDQQRMYEQVLSTVSKWTEVPDSTARGAPSSALNDDEKMFFTRECILRYLRATKWKVPDALKRLQSTLSWRREYGADKFTADYISPENESGKQVIMGWDNDARPCLYLRPGKQNTKMSDRQIHHLCYMLDHTIDMLPPGQETTCLIIDFKGAASGEIPTVGQAKAVLNILQTHNPERLGKALISSTPWYVSVFFKLISPFIDPVTREKMKFHPVNKEHIPIEQLLQENGGDLEFEYDHEVYWPAMTGECKRRKQAYRERWHAGGCKIGEYEEYLRGGSHLSLAEEERKTEESISNDTAEMAV